MVRNTLDANGDLAQVSSKKDANYGFLNYAGAFTYTAAGAVSSMRLGNGKWESTTFNARLQPTQIALGGVQNATNLLKLNYSYGTTANNGNVQSQQTTVQAVGTQPGFTATQNYTYDELNRLKTAEEINDTTSAQMWKQTFTFDRFGNRNFDEANTTATTTFPKNCGTAPSLTVCTADRKVSNPSVNANNKNQLDSSNGYTYDFTGNTTVDAQGRTFVYDAENKQISVSDASGPLGEYVYDGDGKRVKKESAAEETIFVYDAAGKLIAEYSTALNPTPQVSYLTADNLGTPRINTDQTGAVISRHDYQPYGEEIATPERNAGLKYQDDAVRKQFTGYERDQETDLDYAQARYFGSGSGRFTSPDDFLNDTHVSDPQSWNLYVYVRNNPLQLIDPDGRVKKDKDGNVITEERTDEDSHTKIINGKTYYLSPYKSDGGKTRVVWEVKKVTVFADNKKEIRAYQTIGKMQLLTTTTDADGKTSETLSNSEESKYLIEKVALADDMPLSNIANCHGNTFANGQVWIENDQVGALMTGDGYRTLTESENPQEGDVGIFGNANHSVRVESKWHNTYLVDTKGGITKEKTDTVGRAWSIPSDKLKYFTQRPKPKK